MIKIPYWLILPQVAQIKKYKNAVKLKGNQYRRSTNQTISIDEVRNAFNLSELIIVFKY